MTEIGGKTSHTAILARALELPAVAGVRGIFQHVTSQSQVLINANSGALIIDPSPTEIETFLAEKRKYEETKNLLLQMRGLPSVTRDGHKLELVANIGTIQDLPSVLANDAEGVGLYRTEFVFLDRKHYQLKINSIKFTARFLQDLETRNALFDHLILVATRI
ncbi:MAG: hypothetical protein IPK04_07880 [Bdellovibrionales bacterium]|nr:hypothetical protein [Bdellovibrionales bacterium]